MQRFWGCLLLISLCGPVHVFDCRQGIGMVLPKKISQTQSMTASEGVVGVVMKVGSDDTKRTMPTGMPLSQMRNYH